MPVKKLSVSLSPAASAFIDARSSRADGNTSGTISESLERYAAILARERAELRSQLTPGEQALIIDVTNGSLFYSYSLSMLWAEIEDGCSLDRLDQKWEIDAAALVAKVKAAGIAGQAALVDACERWWNRVGAGEQPPYTDLLL